MKMVFWRSECVVMNYKNNSSESTIFIVYFECEKSDFHPSSKAALFIIIYVTIHYAHHIIVNL